MVVVATMVMSENKKLLVTKMEPPYKILWEDLVKIKNTDGVG